MFINTAKLFFIGIGCQRCDYSPKDWCNTKQIAAECDMTEFCKHHIWKPTKSGICEFIKSIIIYLNLH